MRVISLFFLLLPFLGFAEELPQAMITVILDPVESVEVYPEVYEEVEIIPFKLGDSFNEGDLLLKMKNQAYISQLEKAKAGLDFATEDLKIKQSLYKDKLISTLELLQAELNLATAQSAFDDAYRNYMLTMIRAPFDGKIGYVSVKKYERPIRQKAMMRIFNDKTITAKFLIPSRLLSRFQLDQSILVYVRDLGRSFPAKLTNIGSEINPVSLKVNVEAEIDNSSGIIIPGMASYLLVQ